MAPIQVLVAGSTHYTKVCAQSLTADSRFQVTGVLTPFPKPIGRKQEITKNPLHLWALEQQLKVTHVQNKINEATKVELGTEKPDILLVVDFGYIVPKWLLSYPKIAPINVHPSDLPNWRGSSPAQFGLLFGERQAAVSIMKMDEKLDHGPIVGKIYFEIEPDWTAATYYQHAYELVAKQLADMLFDVVRNPNEATPQPEISPTPIARMLTRQDGFVPLEALHNILENKEAGTKVPLLEAYGLPSIPASLFNMWRGLSPWPGLWTSVIKNDKSVRVKLLKMILTSQRLILKSIQYEGKTPTSEIKL